MIWTDPPYNIGGKVMIVAKGVSASHRDLKDASWDQAFRFEDAIPSLEASMAQDCTVYVCSSQFLAGAVWTWMDQRMDFYHACVWSKPNPMPSLSKRHWTWSAELICYGTRGKHAFNFPEQGHALSVWSIPGRAHESAHPTEKPTVVPAHAISHSSREGDLVIDLFTGAGSTVLACESLGRVFAGVELDPRWIDTTVRRWQGASGKSAVLEGDGRSFDEVSRERIGEET
jgi:DNA modification methylase